MIHRLSNDKLLEILSLSQNATGIYTGDDLIIQMANDVMIGFWGKDRSVIGKPLAEAVPELEGQPFVGLLQDVWRTGITYEAKDTPAELLVDGKLQTFYFDFAYRAIKNDLGEIECILHTAVDVTKLQQINESYQQSLQQLQASEDLLNQFIQQVPAGVAIYTGPDLIYKSVNPGYKQFVPNRELIGRSVLEALPELVGTPVEQALRNTYATGQNFYVHDMLIPLSDYEGGPTRDRYFAVSYLAYRDQYGKIAGLFGFALETTEQVKARKATEKLNRELQISEESLRLSVEAARLGTYSVDLESGIVTVNEYCREIFGLAPDYLFTAQIGLSMIEEDEERVREAMNEAIGNDTVFDEQYRIIRKTDNSMRWIRSVGRASKSTLDQKPLFRGILLDITEQKADEQRKNDFIGMVSHELKTPLTSMKGYIQMLQSKAKKGEDAFTAGVLDKASNQVTKMTTMINGFLNVSRLESGKIHIDRQRFDMAMLVKETEEDSIASISSHQVVFAPVVETWVNADRDKIGQVINNLISNAVKYSPPNSIIEVACVTRNSNAVISVKDQGMGISPQDLPKLFERYYRVQAVKETNVAGFGIGLYLCCEIIKRHEGDIWAESKLGEGAIFYFQLPVIY
ncbi:ATP-binding protein [Mucilaginibacter sp. PAMB04274]|uniref:ATP-binding protein n=1 Tax=Mucilaginibacter sp. PAMB04274 TaxID=3138568 RepID=UPI0031F72089